MACVSLMELPARHGHAGHASPVFYCCPMFAVGEPFVVFPTIRLLRNDNTLPPLPTLTPIELCVTSVFDMLTTAAESVNDFETVTLTIYCTTFTERSSVMICKSSDEGIYCGSSSVTKCDPESFWSVDSSRGGLIHAAAGNCGGDGGCLTNLSGCTA